MKTIVAAALVIGLVTTSGFAQPVPGSGRITGSVPGEAKNLTGAGATFPAVLYTKWFSEYVKLTGVAVNYQPIGSGGGIKSISDQTVDFGATDGPMTDEQLAAARGGRLLHVPMAMGAVVPAYNLPELAAASEALRFTPETLAGIYLGDISRWNDPRLVADNPTLRPLDKYIVVVHRSDGSGTTNIWTSYLAAINDTWAREIGAANSVQWPVGLGGKGNEGVAGNVKQTPYSIGYVEEAYAVQNGLPVAQVRNRSGAFITPTKRSITLAAQGVPLPDDLRVKLVNSVNPEAYPIVGFTWILVYAQQADPSKALAIARMLWWCTHDAQAYNAALEYAPLPPDAVTKAEVLIKSIQIKGVRALPASVAK